MSASPAWTLKVEFDGDVRMLEMWPEIVSGLSFGSLRNAISALFGLNLASSERLILSYLDDVGDLCTLAHVTLLDALSVANESGVLSITATRTADILDLSETHEQASIAFATSLPNSHPAETVNGFERFKQQVANDFKDAREDMTEAFAPRPPSPAAAATVANVAGVVVAARLVPVHLTGLAAHSLATAAGTATIGDPILSAPQDGHDASVFVIEEGHDASVFVFEQTSDTEMRGANSDAQSVPAFRGEHPISGASAEMNHFKQQVTNDFINAHKETESAVRDFIGAGHSLLGPWVGSTIGLQYNKKSVLPAVAGGLAGTLVAATLVPVRGARFAIAKLACASSREPAATDFAPQYTSPLDEPDDDSVFVIE